MGLKEDIINFVMGDVADLLAPITDRLNELSTSIQGLSRQLAIIQGFINNNTPVINALAAFSPEHIAKFTTETFNPSNLQASISSIDLRLEELKVFNPSKLWESIGDLKSSIEGIKIPAIPTIEELKDKILEVVADGFEGIVDIISD